MTQQQTDLIAQQTALLADIKQRLDWLKNRENQGLGYGRDHEKRLFGEINTLTTQLETANAQLAATI